MFWKRKQADSEIFSYKNDDRRSSYRVTPSPSAPIIFEVNGEKVRVVNISAGGLAFKCRNCNDGETLAIEFLFPEPNVSIVSILKIKKLTSKIFVIANLSKSVRKKLKRFTSMC